MSGGAFRRPRAWVLVAILGAAYAGALAACSSDSPAKASPGDGGSGPNADAAASSTAPPDAGLVDDRDSGATAPSLLVSSPGKDEDPSLLRAADGTYRLAWYSNRDGSDRIWTKTSANGRDWSAEQPITPSSEAHFYPALLQSKDRRYHLVTWRGSVSDAGAIAGSIEYRTSSDGVTFGAATVLVDARAFAWGPSIAERVPGEIAVAWSSDVAGTRNVYVTTSKNGGMTWAPSPVRVTDDAFNDDLPALAAKGDGTLLMLWQRYDRTATGDAPFSHPSNELVYATSADGAVWTLPKEVTQDPIGAAIPDVISTLYPSADPSGWSVAWSSARGASRTGDLSSLGLSQAPATAANIRQLTDAPGNDYSPRLVATGTPGLYLMAWVSDRTPLADGGTNLEIYSQFVR